MNEFFAWLDTFWSEYQIVILAIFSGIGVPIAKWLYSIFRKESADKGHLTPSQGISVGRDAGEIIQGQRNVMDKSAHHHNGPTVKGDQYNVNYTVNDPAAIQKALEQVLDKRFGDAAKTLDVTEEAIRKFFSILDREQVPEPKP